MWSLALRQQGGVAGFSSGAELLHFILIDRELLIQFVRKRL
jgi:hypothetical protein